MAERPVVYLVDGSSYVYRAFFAIRQQLTTSRGLPTKAVFGFKNMLQKLIRDEQPQYLGVAFDERGPTFRHEMDATYKAHRPPMPDELAVQIPYIHRLVEAFDIPKLSLVGYEADDILGTLARRSGCEDGQLGRHDKDLCQLVTAHTTILDTMKDQRIGVAEVRERFGVGPEGVIDVLGLMGDSSDNIPGVPGVGEKTARELMAQFGSIEALLARLDEVKRPKLREILRQHAEAARQSRLLATIDLQTPITVTLQALTVGEPRLEELRAIYEELEFRVDLQALGSAQATDVTSVAKDYRSITTLEDLEAEIAVLRQAGGFAVDTETTNQDPMRAELVGISLAHSPHEAVYIPLRHAYLGVPPQLDATLVLERLRPLLEDPALPKYGQNIKYDYIVLHRQGITMRGLACDTMVAGYLLNPSRRMNNLVPALHPHQLRRGGRQGGPSGHLRSGRYCPRHRLQC